MYECTEAGGMRNEPRPSVDLSFGPDGRKSTASYQSVVYKAICLDSSTKLPENQAENRKIFLNKTFPLANFDSVQMVQPHSTVFDCLFENMDAEVILLLLDRLNTDEVWAKKAKKILITDQRRVNLYCENHSVNAFRWISVENYFEKLD